MKRLARIALIVLVVVSFAAPAHATRTETHAYVGQPIDRTFLVGEPVGVGSVYIHLQGSETSVKLVIDDQIYPRTGALYWFDFAEESSPAGVFCRTTTLAVPPGAFQLSVVLDPDDAWFGDGLERAHCPNQGAGLGAVKVLFS